MTENAKRGIMHINSKTSETLCSTPFFSVLKKNPSCKNINFHS